MASMTQLIVSLEDTRTGQVEQRVLGDWHECCVPGVIIGTEADCALRLTGPEIAGHHARYYARGHHRFLEILDDAAVVHRSLFNVRTQAAVSERERRRGDSMRVDDSPFRIGPYLIEFSSR